MDKAAVAVGVTLTIWWLSNVLIALVNTSVRKAEHKANETEEPPSRRVLAWHLVHVRDDVAALTAIGPNLTNGLLAAILAVLVMS